MTLSIWRYAHLALAIVSSAFLIVLSVTGVILAYDAVDEKMPPYKVENFNDITLAQVIPTLRENYFEVIEVKVDHNQFVVLDAMDEEGNAFQAYIDPTTGQKIGEVKPKSSFIQWVTALHRSLFLKEPGRAIVGVISFLLMLISISGLILIIKRQHGIKNFFSKVNKDFFSQYFHVVTGRWLLIPVLVVAVTGTLIFMSRLDAFIGEETVTEFKAQADAEPRDLKDIEFFKNTKLRSVEKIEFPFIPDDEAEPFIVHLRKKTITVNQVTGHIISEAKDPTSAIIEKFNVDLHTGRTSIVWAIILGLASLNILFFIYSGFVIMLRRTKNRIKNKINVHDAEIVLLVGSENGSTIFFANKVHQQLLADGKRSYLTEMNNYQVFPHANEIVVFTSTYGLGDPPTNALQFEALVKKHPQVNPTKFSVVGFGSKAYDDYCQYAFRVDEILGQQSWAERLLDVHTINDRSTEEFVQWAESWSDKTLNTLATAPAVYSSKVPKLKKFRVVEKTSITEDNSTFKVLLKARGYQKFESGDLFAIYPNNDQKERFYSVGRVGNMIQLVVKLFPNGLGSGFLNDLKVGEIISGRIMYNTSFHVPKTAKKIAMIANGTGIAPFLGMIHENHQKKEMYLYAGFRYQNTLIYDYQKFSDIHQKKNYLSKLHFAFSREEMNKAYVMDLIKKEEVFFADLLKNEGIVMICGSLRMQKNVEEVLNEIVLKYNEKPLDFYFKNKQILTDCY